MSEIREVDPANIAQFLLGWANGRHAALKTDVEGLPHGDARKEASTKWADDTEKQLHEIIRMLKV